ncbi:tetratricopeptide repeat protein [Micromonospora sp. NPDC048999]|uniref:tetratricopeptide repeat protein n=1 Tax=Micromonospora sp. NPDC048999 TaxID=3155391 RepID=UPI0033C84D5E
MLAELAQLRYDQDRYTEARQHFQESVSRFRDVGETQGTAAALAGLGTACREPGHLAEALHFLAQASALLLAAGDDTGIGYTLRLTGSVRLEQGDYPAALADLTESLAAYRRVGSRRGEALTVRSIGLYHRATTPTATCGPSPTSTASTTPGATRASSDRVGPTRPEPSSCKNRWPADSTGGPPAHPHRPGLAPGRVAAVTRHARCTRARRGDQRCSTVRAAAIRPYRSLSPVNLWLTWARWQRCGSTPKRPERWRLFRASVLKGRPLTVGRVSSCDHGVVWVRSLIQIMEARRWRPAR